MYHLSSIVILSYSVLFDIRYHIGNKRTINRPVSKNFLNIVESFSYDLMSRWVVFSDDINT